MRTPLLGRGVSGLNFSLWSREGGHVLSHHLAQMCQEGKLGLKPSTVKHENRSQTITECDCGVVCPFSTISLSYHVCWKLSLQSMARVVE